MKQVGVAKLYYSITFISDKVQFHFQNHLGKSEIRLAITLPAAHRKHSNLNRNLDSNYSFSWLMNEISVLINNLQANRLLEFQNQ